MSGSPEVSSLQINLRSALSAAIFVGPFIFMSLTASSEANRANSRIDKFQEQRATNREDYLKTLGDINVHLARIDERLHLLPLKPEGK